MFAVKQGLFVAIPVDTYRLGIHLNLLSKFLGPDQFMYWLNLFVRCCGFRGRLVGSHFSENACIGVSKPQIEIEK